MMLARSLARQREIAIRFALGAGRRRVVRQLLAESWLLALGAAVVGYALAWYGLRLGERLLYAVTPSEIIKQVRIQPLTPDPRVFFFILFAACLSSFAIGMLPALQATRGDLTRATRGEVAAGYRAGRLRNALVAAQVAVSVLLLISSGNLLRINRQVQRKEIGLDTSGVLDLDVREELRSRTAALLASDPSVESVAAVWRTPLYGSLRTIPISPEESASPIASGYNFVSSEYFGVFRIPIVLGRNFAPEEARSESPVVIVSEATALRFWPGLDPVGKTIHIALGPSGGLPDRFPPHTRAEVIGVAHDVMSGWIMDGRDKTCLYFPMRAAGAGSSSLVVRVEGNAEVARRGLDLMLGAAVPGALGQITPMQQVLDVQFFPFRVYSWIAAFLGCLATMLTLSGIYGVLSYIVGQRSKEFAIRMALGASPFGVLRSVLTESVKLALLGIVFGVPLALAVSRLLATQVVDVNTYDSLAFFGGVALILTAAMAASAFPARRATRVDPVTALRYE